MTENLKHVVYGTSANVYTIIGGKRERLQFCQQECVFYHPALTSRQGWLPAMPMHPKATGLTGELCYNRKTHVKVSVHGDLLQL